MSLSLRLSEAFIEKHSAIFPESLIPDSWNLNKFDVYYQLDLKMCQLKSLDYAFAWENESSGANYLSSITETPFKVIKLDVSLNELTSLSHESLEPFKGLRCLDASLNQIKYFQGIEVLRHLHTLNLSHNCIKRVDSLLLSHSLGDLNLSNNQIEDISGLPSLINLRIFNISSNKLQSLDGVSSLPRLEEIYADNNILKSLTPLVTCFHVCVISAANNQIHSIDDVMRVVSSHKSLESLNLSGNPVERQHTYQSDILRAANKIWTLDNVSVKPMAAVLDDHMQHADNIISFQASARQMFESRLRVAKERMEENVNFLQRRIVAIQKEFSEFEKKNQADMEACLRYLATRGMDELSIIGRESIGAASRQGDYRSRRRKPKFDYSGIKETDEVLRNVFKELVRQKGQQMD
ncbi:leucine-rich repeat and guanylate kinase domain-containing protein [Biomphalaria pfeifferi]|uniref:Leucine-rich repeat and guanylate kinase domain-containing protein n=1 Tax=Biomphalaria pfeifferi TaxID=112525 RepID=A0AAD8FLJ2_BIOPF|nr:leucine-rich repeat and guanylate kinase domain-containing protein [Biomphalaria pfeifferi]